MPSRRARAPLPPRQRAIAPMRRYARTSLNAAPNGVRDHALALAMAAHSAGG